ncbi:MAG TPA: hypothetical protein VLW85_15135 [Myxococcales bacterium]|nr:hypothetical protein [Myxococcales bacterium]
MAAFVEQPWFRLRSEWIIYGDEEMTRPIIAIKNRRWAAINMEHDLFDGQSGQKLGVVRNRGFSSLFRDSWDLLDGEDRPVGEMMEDGLWWLRRVLRFIPGRHRIELGGREVAWLTQEFRLFRRVFNLDLAEVDDPIEPRFAIACSLIAIMADLRREERQ